MVCPHCNSTDIITVQGQRFCISCGRMLEGELAVPAEAKTVSPPAAEPAAPVPAVLTIPKRSIAKKPAKRKPGRPKAGRLDVAAPPVTMPEPVAAPAAVTAALPAGPRLKPTSSGPRQLRRLNDLAPAARPVVAVESIPTPASIQSSAPAQAAFEGVVAATLRERVRPAALVWAVWPAGLVAIAVGALTYILLGHQAAGALARTQRAGWGLWGELIAAAGLYYLSRNLAAAAVAYGAARRDDHRPVTRPHQLAAAVNSFWGRLTLDLLVTVLQLIVVAAGAGLLVMGGVVWPVPAWTQLVALFMAFLGLMYVLAGLGLVQGLGRVGLTLGAISPGRAFRLSWGFFIHHFELLGFKVVTAVVELLLMLPWIIAAIAVLTLLPPDLHWLAAAGVAVLTLIAGTLIGAGMAVWWQAVYSRLVRRYHLDQAGTLLTGRPVAHARRGALVMMVLVGSIVAALTIAWPWLIP